MSATTKRLPAKPSALIRLAIDDLEKTEKDSRYIIEMLSWHRPIHYGPKCCYVCLAGAVMAQSLGSDINTDLSPSAFETSIDETPMDRGDTADKLRALDRFRVGDLTSALQYLGLTPAARDAASALINAYERGRVFIYGRNPDGFKRYMRGMADDLEAVGL